ncbi:MAG: hypothetical protein KDC95_18185 [Planctomycetes bacterium]|nr:hypothetical protein [Planctomycetota bacterium]
MMNPIPSVSRLALGVAACCGFALLRQVTTAQSTNSNAVQICGTTIEFGGVPPVIDLVSAVTPRIGLSGASSMTLPTISSTRRVLRFGYEAEGWNSHLKIGDDRDPIHGFKHMIEIDGTGTVSLSGCKKTVSIVPQQHYEFTLSWTWTNTGLFVDTLLVDDGTTTTELRSGEYRAGNQGQELRFEHSGTGMVWLDSISIAPQ